MIRLIAHATSVLSPLLPGGASSYNVVGDAALLVLAAPTTAPAIALAVPGAGGGTGAANSAPAVPGTAARIAGWGVTAPRVTKPPVVLRVARTVIQGPAVCARYNPQFSDPAQLCAIGAPADRVSICNGDSGGPLVARRPGGTPVEVGIGSTSIACDPRVPDMFTRVAYVEPWIAAWTAALEHPSAAPTSAPTAQPHKGSVTYRGRTSQAGGRLAMTLGRGGAGVTCLELTFTLACPRGPRGPITTSAAWSNPLALSPHDRTRMLTGTYVGAHGWLYSIAARVPAKGSASGTVAVVSRNGACQTGRVAWRAAA